MKDKPERVQGSGFRVQGGKKLISGAFVAPMEAAVFRDGGVVVRGGRISAIGERAKLRREHPDAIEEDLGPSVILPGLVNPHVHLELSDRVCENPPAGGFGEWIAGLRNHARSATSDIITNATQRGIEQCLRYGVTCVGDISRHPQITRQAISQSPLRAVSYGEVIALAKLRDTGDEQIARAVAPVTGPRVQPGITPHAPYTVEPQVYRNCLDAAQRLNLPLATHLAESLEESHFLSRHTGALRRVWDDLTLWDQHVPTYEQGPIRFAKHLGLLDHPTLLAHVNYCDDEELTLLASCRASVVYCPRTHAYFGHPPHRWREMLSRGINVAIGTDSCASSPGLNLVDDLRLAHRLAPDFPVEDLWKMVTIRAAEAIQQSEVAGTLSVGKSADLTVFPAMGNNPLTDILESTVVPSRIWIEGAEIM